MHVRGVVAGLAAMAIAAAVAVPPVSADPGTGTNRLKVKITGLPDGVDAKVRLVGPHGTRIKVWHTRTLRDLPRGRYRVKAKKVIVARQLSSPKISDARFRLRRGSAKVTKVRYGVTGLSVLLRGLPPATDARVEVTGQGRATGFHRTVPSSERLTGLTPGRYRITAPDIQAPDGLARPAPSDTTLRVRHGSVGTVTIDYSYPCGHTHLPRTVRYASTPGVAANLQSLDVYRPSRSCGAPVVIWIHGGGYVRGDKSNHVADKIRLFNAAGWIFVSANYRLSTVGDPDRPRYPDHFDDVAAAVMWVRNHIGDYGGDGSTIALLGHSAGADIVSNVLADPVYLQRSGGTIDDVSCSGPLDTEGFDKAKAGPGPRAQWVNALGNNPRFLTETSATWLLGQPGARAIPTIGTVRGTPSRRAIARGYFAAVRALGAPVTEINAIGLSHEDVNRLIGAPGDTRMTPPLMRFLTSCFA